MALRRVIHGAALASLLAATAVLLWTESFVEILVAISIYIVFLFGSWIMSQKGGGKVQYVEKNPQSHGETNYPGKPPAQFAAVGPQQPAAQAAHSQGTAVMRNWNWELILKAIAWIFTVAMMYAFGRAVHSAFTEDEKSSSILMAGLLLAFLAVLIPLMTGTFEKFWGAILKDFKLVVLTGIALLGTIYIAAVGREHGFAWWWMPEFLFAATLTLFFGRLSTKEKLHPKEWLTYGVVPGIFAFWAAVIYDEKGILSRIVEMGGFSESTELFLGLAFGAFLVAVAFGIGIRITGVAKKSRVKDVLGL